MSVLPILHLIKFMGQILQSMIVVIYMWFGMITVIGPMIVRGFQR